MHEDVGKQHFKDSKSFIKYINNMNDIYKKHWRMQSK